MNTLFGIFDFSDLQDKCSIPSSESCRPAYWREEVWPQSELMSKAEALIIDDSDDSTVPVLPAESAQPEEKKTVKRRVAKFRGETYKIMERERSSESLLASSQYNKAAIQHAKHKRARFESLRDAAQENAVESAKQADFCWEQVTGAGRKISDGQLWLKSDRHVREAIHTLLQISNSETRHKAFMSLMHAVTLLCGDGNLLLKEMAQQPFYIDVDTTADPDEQ